MINSIGKLLFWFFLGTSLRSFQVHGVETDIVDLFTIAIGALYVMAIVFKEVRKSSQTIIKSSSRH